MNKKNDKSDRISLSADSPSFDSTASHQNPKESQIRQVSVDSLKNKSTIKPVSSTWTTRQIIWIVVQGLGAGGICFGVIYGIGIAVYSKNPPPTLWYFPIPIAGDFGVMCILLTLANFFICGILQTFDVLQGLVEPLDPAVIFFWPSSDSQLLWWTNTTDLLISEQNFSQRFVWTLTRSIPWMLYTFAVLWPLFTGFSYYIWGNNNYNSFPQPQFMSATFGGSAAIITVPVWAVLTLGSMGSIEMRKKLQEERATESIEL